MSNQSLVQLISDSYEIDIGTGKSICAFCKKSLVLSVTTRKAHLAGGQIALKYRVGPCEGKVPDHIKAPIIEAYAQQSTNQEKKRTIASVLMESEQALQEGEVQEVKKSHVHTKQLTLREATDITKLKAANEAIALCFYRNGWSFNSVESTEFGNMVRKILACAWDHGVNTMVS